MYTKKIVPKYSILRTNLGSLVPEGLIVSRKSLVRKGIRRSSIDNALRSGLIVSVWPGIYARSGVELKPEDVVASLQRMGSDLVVGGTSALELRGRNYYVPLRASRTVQLHGCDRLRPWVNTLNIPEKFRRCSTARLLKRGGRMPQDDSYGQRFPFVALWPWGRWTVRISTTERALFEVLHGVPSRDSFEDAELLMQGLPDLSPTCLERLLRRTRSVKVKRLFFWLAERQGFAWASRLDPSNFDLGSGKRVIQRSGKLVAKYGITVPEVMVE